MNVKYLVIHMLSKHPIKRDKGGVKCQEDVELILVGKRVKNYY